MGAKRYNSKEIIFTWAALNIKGFAAENFISIERVTEAATSSVGAGGEVTVETLNDRRKKITLRLFRTSTDNALLSTIFQAQELSGEIFFAPMAIKDGLGNDLHVAPEVWIMDEPDAEYSAESGIREWVFEAANMKSFHGGS